LKLHCDECYTVVPQRGLYIVLNMKLLWPPAPLSVSTSPTTAAAAAAVAALAMETAPGHRQRQTNSLLNLCLSLYTAGCVRKAGHTNKRRANKKNELALVCKDFDLDQVRLLPPTNSLPRSLAFSQQLYYRSSALRAPRRPILTSVDKVDLFPHDAFSLVSHSIFFTFVPFFRLA